MQRVTEQFSELGYIRWVEVFNRDALVVAHSIRSRLNATPKRQHFAAVETVLTTNSVVVEHDPDVVVFRPLTNLRGDVIGVIETVIDSKPIAIRHESNLTRLLLVFGTSYVLLLIGMVFVLRWAVVSPIIRLSQFISKGASAPETTRGDEIGNLQRAYQQLLENLSTKRVEIQRNQQSHQRLLEAEKQDHHALRLESIGRLAGGVAHDFNNLLMVIINNAVMLQRTLKDNAFALELAAEIESAAEKGSDVSRQLLAYSRKQPLHPTLIDANEHLVSLASLLAKAVGEDIELHIEQAREPVFVLVDPTQFEQVLINLAINARDAMGKSGRLDIRVRTEDIPSEALSTHENLEAGTFALLEVIDNGSGMTPEVAAHAFDPFFTTKDVDKGTGLGLAAARGFAEQSGGYIELDTELGRGTTLRTYLPLRDPPQHENNEQPSVETRSKYTILLVEDEESVARVAKRILEAEGFHVLVAHSGREALQAAQGHRGTIDLLLTDVLMPGMRGTELAPKLVKRFPGLPVVYMSGYSDDHLQNIDAKPEQLLAKPFRPEQLIATVRGQLTSHRAALRLVPSDSG